MPSPRAEKVEGKVVRAVPKAINAHYRKSLASIAAKLDIGIAIAIGTLPRPTPRVMAKATRVARKVPKVSQAARVAKEETKVRGGGEAFAVFLAAMLMGVLGSPIASAVTAASTAWYLDNSTFSSATSYFNFTTPTSCLDFDSPLRENTDDFDNLTPDFGNLTPRRLYPLDLSIHVPDIARCNQLLVWL